MDNVVPFNSPKSEKHMTGDAFCICCKHTWVAVAVIGTEWLECPNCETTKGRFNFPVVAKEVAHWNCACGNDLFHITEEYLYCPNCGQEQNF
jgi:hypothetical protein